VYKTADVSESPPTQPQMKIFDIPEPKEENPPVICRVLQKSEKDSYHM